VINKVSDSGFLVARRPPGLLIAMVFKQYLHATGLRSLRSTGRAIYRRTYLQNDEAFHMNPLRRLFGILIPASPNMLSQWPSIDVPDIICGRSVGLAMVEP
jgi:hypothetical protein